jgi:hypothetical protein
MFTTICYCVVDDVIEEKVTRSNNPIADIMAMRQDPTTVKILSWKTGEIDTCVTLIRLFTGQWTMI